MAARRDTQWSLYVDESGQFGDADDPVAVAGLVVREGLPGGSPEELLRALELTLPEFPWPLHAKNVNVPAYVALAWHRRAPAKTADPATLARHGRRGLAVDDAIACFRDVMEPILGRPVPLFVTHVGGAVRQSMGGFGDRVRATPAVTSTFDHAVGGAFVFADFIANHSRWALAETYRSLRAAERKMAARLGAVVRSGSPPLSHLAASGRAAALVRSAPLAAGQAPRALLPLEPGFRRWAREQAWEWAEAVSQ